jgi:putative ABC transport system permease protein
MLLQMNLRGIPQRLGASAVTVIGVACVVAVLVAMLSMGTGVRQMSAKHVRADRAMVFSKGAPNSYASNFPKATEQAIADMPGIRKGVDGNPLVAAESVLLITGRRKRDHGKVPFLVAGVTGAYTRVYPELKLTAGRMFQPGLREVIAGRSRYEEDLGMEIGDSIRFRGADWKIVGHFDADRSLNLNLLTDADTLMSAANRSSYGQLSIVLESAASFDELQAAIKANPSLQVDLKHEAEAAKEVSGQVAGLLDFASYFIGVVMGLGATLGAVNAMYAIVDERRREMATLRAIGFKSFPIIVSVLIEATLLATPGAILGILIAWLFFDGSTINPVGVSIKLAVTPSLAGTGLIWALLVGLIGGLLPAIRASRVPVATALGAA